MKTMKIFEPAMCCPTGICGVGVDPELLRISTVLNTLKENGIEVERYNLTNAPMEFVNHKMVAEFLQKFGPDKLPVVMVDDFIVITGRYPLNEEFTSWLEISPDLLGVEACCDEDAGCCCTDDCCSEESEGCCTDDCCSEDESEECCEGGCC